ncbi:MAG: hypothetical protein ABW072_18705 [Sedimenticola sp.]
MMTFDISDVPTQDNVVDLVRSETQAVASFLSEYTNERGIRILRIPEGWEQHPLCLLMVSYVNSSHFKKLAQSSRRKRFHYLAAFFKFLETGRLSPNSQSKALLNKNYLNYLREQGAEDTAIKSVFQEFRALLNKVQDRTINGEHFNGWGDVTLEILKDLPTIITRPSIPNPALSQLFEGCSYSDSDLIVSLRHVATWYVLETKRQRELLLDQQPSLLDDLDRLRAYTKSPFEFPLAGVDTATTLRKKNSIHPGFRLDSEKMYGNLIRAIVDTGDEILIERLYFSDRRNLQSILRAEKATTERMRDWAMGLVKDGGELKGHIRISKGVRYTRHHIRTISFAQLLFPDFSEVTAMHWLLASERIQASGMNKLAISDVHSDKAGIQIVSYEKRRSSIEPKKSPIYKKGSPVHEAYAYWLKLIESNSAFYELGARKDSFLPLSTFTIAPSQINITNNELLPLQLLGLSGAKIREKCLDERPESKIFLDYYLQLQEAQMRVGEQEKEYGKLLQKKVSVKRAEAVSMKRISVTSQAIAQSRVYMDGDRPGALSEQGAQLDAMVTAHSVETKRNIYKDRATVKEVVAKSGKFAAQVGELMVEDAKKLSDMLHGVQVVSVSEIKDRLGLSSPLEGYSDIETISALIEEAEAHEFVTGMLGEISDGKTTYIIMTPLTAALMKGYINHIDSEAERLRNDNPDRVHVHFLQKAYLLEVLDRFSRHITTKGDELLSEYEFPYPALS